MFVLRLLMVAGLVTAPAFAEISLTCATVDGKYQVHVYDEPTPAADVTVDNRVATFGHLICDVDNEAFTCHSKGVADAGFSVRVEKSQQGYAGTISAITFAGERELGKLTCR